MKLIEALRAYPNIPITSSTYPESFFYWNKGDRQVYLNDLAHRQDNRPYGQSYWQPEFHMLETDDWEPCMHCARPWH